MTDLHARRRFFAEEVQMTSNLKSASLVDALATVPRERFLPPGPWIVRSEADFQLTRTADAAVLAARVATFVAIYSGIGLRDAEINAALGQALLKSPFPPIKTFRRDPHEPAPGCWLHTPVGCLSL